MSCSHICHLIRIMFSIPPNTGWLEQDYSILELICQKRHNQLSISLIDIVLFSSSKAESQGIICIRGRVDELNKKINLKIARTICNAVKKFFMVIVLNTHILLLSIDRLSN